MASTQQTAAQHTQKQLIIELLLERLVPLVEWWSRLATVALPKIPFRLWCEQLLKASKQSSQLMLCRRQVASLKIPNCVLPMPRYNNYAKRHPLSPAISTENMLKNTLRKTIESEQVFPSLPITDSS